MTVERVASAVAVGAMLATPFTRRGSAGRRGLTTATVVAASIRTAAIDVSVQGGRRGALRAALVGGLTIAAELIGVRTLRPFGAYEYTGALRPSFGRVPVVVPLAWYAVAVPAAATADAALGPRSSPASRVALGAAALTAWDLFLDPQMTAEGYWRWHHPGPYRGVPTGNFVGWAAVGAAAMGVIELTRRSVPPARAHVAGYLALGVLETLAFATFWRDRTVAALGGLAMVPLGAVALARRDTAPPHTAPPHTAPPDTAPPDTVRPDTAR
jgi:uncharacterized membrane protein